MVKLVREKFMHTKKFETKEQLQAFISELYPFLLEHMNSGLNEVGIQVDCVINDTFAIT